MGLSICMYVCMDVCMYGDGHGWIYKVQDWNTCMSGSSRAKCELREGKQDERTNERTNERTIGNRSRRESRQGSGSRLRGAGSSLHGGFTLGVAELGLLDASGFGYSNSFLITYRYWLDYYLPALGYLSIYLFISRQRCRRLGFRAAISCGCKRRYT